MLAFHPIPLGWSDFVGQCFWGHLLFRHYYIDCPRAFRAPGKFELHTGALLQGIEILPPQNGSVEEDLLPIFCTDETEPPKPDKALYLPFQTYRLLPQDIW